MKFLENIVEFFSWCWIFLSPTAIFGFIGYAIYHHYGSGIGMASFAGLSFLGAAIGFYFAEKVRKSVGCSIFLTKNYWAGAEKEDESASKKKSNNTSQE